LAWHLIERARKILPDEKLHTLSPDEAREAMTAAKVAALMENMIEAARARDQQELDNMRAFMEAYITRYPPDAQKRISDLAVTLFKQRAAEVDELRSA
jgi:hypothetical protein